VMTLRGCGAAGAGRWARSGGGTTEGVSTRGSILAGVGPGGGLAVGVESRRTASWIRSDVGGGRSGGNSMGGGRGAGGGSGSGKAETAGWEGLEGVWEEGPSCFGGMEGAGLCAGLEGDDMWDDL